MRAPIEQALLSLHAATLWYDTIAGEKTTETIICGTIQTLAATTSIGATQHNQRRALELCRATIERIADERNDDTAARLLKIEETLRGHDSTGERAITQEHNIGLRVYALRNAARCADTDPHDLWQQILTLIIETENAESAIAHALRTRAPISFEARETEWLIEGARRLGPPSERGGTERFAKIAKRLRWRIAGVGSEARDQIARQFEAAINGTITGADR